MAEISGRRAKRARGFTLIELMIVVAIIGVLAGIAAIVIDTEPDIRSVTNQVKNSVSEASRAAIAGGPVRSDVAESEGFSARARLLIDSDEGGQFVAVQQRFEDDAASTSVWRHFSRSYLPRNVQIYGYDPDVARLESGGTPIVIDDDGAEILCISSGSCGPATLYLQTDRGDRQTRIVILPFAGAPSIFHGW